MFLGAQEASQNIMESSIILYRELQDPLLDD